MRNARPAALLGAGAAGVVLLLAACSGTATPASSPSATTSSDAGCRRAVAAVVTATQTYVDSFAAASNVGADTQSSPAPRPSASDTPSPDTVFQEAVAAARERLVADGCDAAQTRTRLEEGLTAVSAQGPVAGAVLRQISASLTGTAETEPTTRDVTPSDDLLQEVAELPGGSTLVLGPGTYRLDESLVLLSPLTVRGDGAGSTTIVTSAADIGLLAIASGRVELDGLTIRHEGTDPANVVLAGPSVALVATGSTFTGAVPQKNGTGGAGILMYDPGTERPADATTLEVTDSMFVDNGSAGIVLTGGNVTSIEGTTFRGNGQCGLCFLDASSGSVRGGTFTNNAVAVAATGTATPSVVGGTTRGGEVGVQASDDAAPVIKDLTIRAAARAGLIWSGRATGAIDGVRCVNVPFGLVVGKDVAPTVTDTDCPVAPSG